MIIQIGLLAMILLYLDIIWHGDQWGRRPLGWRWLDRRFPIPNGCKEHPNG